MFRGAQRTRQNNICFNCVGSVVASLGLCFFAKYENRAVSGCPAGAQKYIYFFFRNVWFRGAYGILRDTKYLKFLGAPRVRQSRVSCGFRVGFVGRMVFLHNSKCRKNAYNIRLYFAWFLWGFRVAYDSIRNTGHLKCRGVPRAHRKFFFLYFVWVLLGFVGRAALGEMHEIWIFGLSRWHIHITCFFEFRAGFVVVFLGPMIFCKIHEISGFGVPSRHAKITRFLNFVWALLWFP
jgi:hypothetical protein